MMVVIVGCGGGRSAVTVGRGAGGSGLGVKIVTYVVTTVGVGPGTLKMVVMMLVSTFGSERTWLRLTPTLWTFSRGMHWEYHSLRKVSDPSPLVPPPEGPWKRVGYLTPSL